MALIWQWKLFNKKKLSKLNDNHGRALAALECYAIRFANNPTKNFDFYNLNNLANNKTNKQLIGKCKV